MPLFLRGIAAAAACRRAALPPSLPCRIKLADLSAPSTGSRPSPCNQRPWASQAEIIAPATMLISCRDSFDVKRGKKLEILYTKLPPKDFCTFVETNSREEIVTIFREIEKEIECNRRVQDFHMRVMDGEGGFRVEIYYGVVKSGPAASPVSECILCHPNVPLFAGQSPNVEARECVLEEFSDHPYAVCRLDAKGRCGFIITPVRHVDRMSELNDDELFDLWSLAVRVLRQANLPFTAMILNHGTYRNVEHLHLKVWVDPDLYENYRAHWSRQRQELWNRLQYLAYTGPRRRALSKKSLS